MSSKKQYRLKKARKIAKKNYRDLFVLKDISEIKLYPWEYRKNIKFPATTENIEKCCKDIELIQYLRYDKSFIFRLFIEYPKLLLQAISTSVSGLNDLEFPTTSEELYNLFNAVTEKWCGVSHNFMPAFLKVPISLIDNYINFHTKSTVFRKISLMYNLFEKFLRHYSLHLKNVKVVPLYVSLYKINLEFVVLLRKIDPNIGVSVKYDSALKYTVDITPIDFPQCNVSLLKFIGDSSLMDSIDIVLNARHCYELVVPYLPSFYRKYATKRRISKQVGSIRIFFEEFDVKFKYASKY